MRSPERQDSYERLWHSGVAQSDAARLMAEDIDWDSRVVSYQRQKTKTVPLLYFGDEVAALLR